MQIRAFEMVLPGCWVVPWAEEGADVEGAFLVRLWGLGREGGGEEGGGDGGGGSKWGRW